MKIRKSAFAAAIFLFTAFVITGCGGGSSGGENNTDSSSDAYGYVVGWELPDSSAANGFHLAATDSTVFASLSRIGTDYIYSYQTNGTLNKDVMAEISTEAKKPKQPMGIVALYGQIYLADQTNQCVWEINPTSPESSSTILANYSSRYVFGLAIKGTTIYTAHAETSYDDWTIERRDAGDAAADMSVSFDNSSDFSHTSLSIDSSGNLFAADAEKGKVYKYNSDLALITEWSLEGADSSYDAPYGIAVNSDGSKVFVLDSNNYQVQIYDGSGAYLGKFGSKGTGNGQFTWAWGIAVSPDGTVYIGDKKVSSVRIQKFTAK